MTNEYNNLKNSLNEETVKKYCKVICVNGAKRSGKDTFTQLCQQYLGEDRSYAVSSVDFVKWVAKEAGWDGTKTEKDRKFLSDLKDLLTQWNDVPYHKIMESVSDRILYQKARCIDCNNLVVFVHVREPEEIAKLAERVNAKTLLIRRASAEEVTCSNHADEEVLNYDYDYVIDNNGTLSDLAAKAIEFCEMSLKR